MLIVDFIRRWWWMLALAMLLTVAAGAGGVALIAAPAALVALILDAQRGMFRVVRTLPVTGRVQSRAWWFIGVPLIPLLSLPALAAGLWIEGMDAAEAVPPMVAAKVPWFTAAVQAWTALGYLGLCFLLAMHLPTRPPQGILEKIGQGIVGGLWGISIPAVMFLFPLLPTNPAAVALWHQVLFVATPICVVLSYFAAPEMTHRRTFLFGAKPGPRPSSEAPVRASRFTGVALYAFHFNLQMLAVVGLMALFQAAFMRWVFGQATMQSPGFGIQYAMFTIYIAAITTEAVGLRVLRMLPLSTMQLTGLLLSNSLSAGLGVAAIVSFWLGLGDPAWPRLVNFATLMVAFTGCGAFALAIMLHIASSARLFVCMLFAIVPSALSVTFAAHGVWIALGGAALNALAFFLIHRGLRKSSVFYLPRRMFGIGGESAMAGR